MTQTASVHSLRSLVADPTAIAVIGDWHGQTSWALRMIEFCHRRGITTLVHVGDLGFDLLPGHPDFAYLGEEKTTEFFAELESALAERGMVLLWLVGNHDNHEALVRIGLDPATDTRPITPHIHNLPRGYRWAWPDADGVERVWMALGGAVSMDRDNLTSGIDWWPGEAISYAEAHAAAESGLSDVLLLHDAPEGVDVPGIYGPGYWPTDVYADAVGHRKLLASVVEQVRPKVIFHGHFHTRYDTEIDLGWDERQPEWTGVVQVHGLDKNESTWSLNMVLVDPAGKLLTWPAPVHQQMASSPSH